MDELYRLAEEQDGLLSSKAARELGITDSALVRLAQRGRLERVSRGVYRIAQYPPDRLAQYREAVLWAQASQGPQMVALSHGTALLLYGISDLNPSRVELTVPKSARLRRQQPKWITVHKADLSEADIGEHEGIPVTSVERSILDVLASTHRIDVARQATTDALREGLLTTPKAQRIRAMINRSSRSTERSQPDVSTAK